MFDPGEHVEEAAELYALGDCSATERGRIERHLQRCAQCARRVGDAEAAVLHLIEAQAAHFPSASLAPVKLGRARQGWAWFAAVAAAFVLGLFLPAGFRTPVVPPSQESLATTAMLGGHFLHAQFVPRSAGAPKAKVIYARSGGWLYVIAAAGSALDVAVVERGMRRIVARLPAGRQTRSVFIARSARADAVVLLDRGREIARANVGYVKAEPR
jgi:anti-sigma factor RsiW